jgi:hypothetical protein
MTKRETHEKSWIPRKFRIGQNVVMPSGLEGKVIGSALYGVRKVDGKVEKSPNAHVTYRVKVEGKPKTFYRNEDQLRKPRK